MSPVPNQHHSNGTASPRENGLIGKKIDHQDRDRVGGPHSPRSGTSSNASTPSNKKLEEKPSTPISKSVTPTNSNSTNGIGVGNSSNSNNVVKAVSKPPVLNPNYPHYLGAMNGGAPHELQAVAYNAAAAAAAAGHNLPAGLNNYPRAPIQLGFDPHPQLRAPPLAAIPGGKA